MSGVCKGNRRKKRRRKICDWKHWKRRRVVKKICVYGQGIITANDNESGKQGVCVDKTVHHGKTVETEKEGEKRAAFAGERRRESR